MLTRWMVAVSVVLFVGTASAGKKKPEKKPAPVAEPAPVEEAPVEAPPVEEPDPLANLPHVEGPKLVDLGHQAEIELPAGLTLFERATAQDLMRKLGNDADAVVAAILPPAGTGDWLIVIEAEDVGYVSDEDADELDAATMLEQFKAGTARQNVERHKLGVPELYVDGWTERPHYEAAAHHLVWGLDAHDSNGKVINFLTRFLGRNGYLSVNLIDEPQNIERSKQQAMAILNAVRFKAGAQYADHESSDRDSGLGLRALVLGGAGVAIAKKGGILIALLLALKKGFIVVLAAIGGFFKWLFGRKKDVPSTPPLTPDADGGAPPVG